MIRQLSVLVENKPGSLMEVTSRLTEAYVNIRAVANFDAPDFGILRLIVSDVDKAVEVLRAENFAVMLTDVVCISCPNVAGSLSAILECLAVEQIFIEYMYAFAQGDTANVVIRPNDLKKCVQVLEKCQCDILNKNNL